MITSRLLSGLLARRFRDPEPGSDGGGSGPILNDSIFNGVSSAPAADASAAPAPASAPAVTPVADSAAAPAARTPAAAFDPLAGAKAAMEAIGQPEPTTAPKPGATDPAAGPARGPDGKFLSKAADPATPAAAAAPAATPAATPAPAAAKPEDELTPPEGMNERATARWQALTERVKTTEARHTETSQALDSVRTLVRDSGLQPNEFTDMLDMARAFKSNDPAMLQRAMQQLDGLRGDVARRLGVEVPGVDLLAKHADLKADVDGMLMTRERAVEIAKLRDAQAAYQENQRGQQEVEQHRNLVTQASQAMDAELTRRAGTPGHQERLNAIGNYFKDASKMKEFVTTYQPQQWAKVLGLMYDNIVVPAPAPTPVPPQPLRSSNVRAGAAGVQNGPMTAHTAIAGAFDALGI